MLKKWLYVTLSVIGGEECDDLEFSTAFGEASVNAIFFFFYLIIL